MFTLDIGIKNKGEVSEVFKICDEIEDLLKLHCVSSGYGFDTNIRDIQFEFETEIEAKAAETKVKEIFKKHKIRVSKTSSYINVKEEKNDSNIFS